MMWWILQLSGCLVVASTNILNRMYGLCTLTYTYELITTLIFIAWVFPKSYELAPSFFNAWFLGQASLTLFGVTGSLLIFNEILTLQQILGGSMVFVGGMLLII